MLERPSVFSCSDPVDSRTSKLFEFLQLENAEHFLKLRSSHLPVLKLRSFGPSHFGPSHSAYPPGKH
jgi:hypothetical protein